MGFLIPLLCSLSLLSLHSHLRLARQARLRRAQCASTSGSNGSINSSFGEDSKGKPSLLSRRNSDQNKELNEDVVLSDEAKVKKSNSTPLGGQQVQGGQTMQHQLQYQQQQMKQMNQQQQQQQKQQQQQQRISYDQNGMPTGQPIGGVAGVTFQNQQPVSGGTGQSIGPTLNGGGQLGGAYGAVAHGVQVFSHNLNPARQQGQSAYTGGMMVNDGRMHSLDAQISPRSSNGSVVQMGMVHLGSVAVVAGVPLSSHYQQQQQQQHPYTQYHNSGSPSAGAMSGGIGAGAMGGLAGSMQAPGHPGGIGGNGCIVGGMEGHSGVGGGSIGTNYIAGQFSSQLQQQGQSSSMDALPAARSSGSSCNDATRQADYSVSNPSDLAMRHRDLFSRAPSKVYLACPEAVPRVQGMSHITPCNMLFYVLRGCIGIFVCVHSGMWLCHNL